MTTVVLAERAGDTISGGTLEALTLARRMGAGDVAVLMVGPLHDDAATVLAAHGAGSIHVAEHDLLAGYNPQAWGDVLAGAARHVDADVVIAPGSDQGNEVLAHAAAVLDIPMVANVLEVESTEPFTVRRVRWGGSLIERATVSAGGPLALSVASHALDPEPADTPGSATVHPFTPELDPAVAGCAVVERVQRAAGLTLATAPVVVSGGRGVGSADGFAPLEELAALLGGVVGCSRAVTNNGWRNHTDQVGQTGTRIAPEIYIACGISGAIQHWVGAMASKRILAINTDRNANMVTKADDAVIGDLHQVVPAITAEIRRRRATP